MACDVSDWPGGKISKLNAGYSFQHKWLIIFELIFFYAFNDIQLVINGACWNISLSITIITVKTSGRSVYFV